MTAQRIVVMGIAGSGKTTVGTAVAARLGAAFTDADALHPAANVAKMAAGHPLDDADRWPWLARLRAELRAHTDIVVTCSALKRSYRDLLRGADDVRFVLLAVDEATAEERAGERTGHFMGAAMVASQLEAFESPAVDETDVLVVEGTRPFQEVVAAVLDGLSQVSPGLQVAPLLADGSPDRSISDDDLAAHLDSLVAAMSTEVRRVLLVPPDHTRLHSRAGDITVRMRDALTRSQREVAVLPALGTHVRMDDASLRAMFGESLLADDLLAHDWRSGLRQVGEISADEVSVVTGGRFGAPIPIAVDVQLFDGWDLVVSIGQVVPHEVIGMANFTKNLVIGLGGGDTIHRSHFVGAVSGMESIMGRRVSPVRDLVDAAFDRALAPAIDVLWVLTVVEDTDDGMVLRGLFAGEGGSMASGGAAFRDAAELASQVNVTLVDEPFDRVACWLDPVEFHSTWLGNKAVYRTRMAVADGGELVVLAPGVRRFGEDDLVDALIRRHGYRGTDAALEAARTDAEVAANLGAAAHLVHGSSEGRFRIVWCTDPDAGGLTREEVEGVGYEWRPLREELERLGIDGSQATGDRVDAAGRSFFYVANPAMGLWSTADRFG